MREVVLFAFTIIAVGIAVIYGIINGHKNDEPKLLSKENTDSVRGLVICMIMASHMAQFVAGGYTKKYNFSMGRNWRFGIFPSLRIWK